MTSRSSDWKSNYYLRNADINVLTLCYYQIAVCWYSCWNLWMKHAPLRVCMCACLGVGDGLGSPILSMMLIDHVALGTPTCLIFRSRQGFILCELCRHFHTMSFYPLLHPHIKHVWSSSVCLYLLYVSVSTERFSLIITTKFIS